MRLRHVAMLMLLLFMTGCATTEQTAIPDMSYPNSHTTYDMQFAWKSAMGQAYITISGTMKNQSYYYITEPELTAALLDRDGKIIAQGTFIFFPHQMALDETAPFVVRIPLTEGQIPDRIRFTYRYRLAEEGRSGAPRFHSFDANP